MQTTSKHLLADFVSADKKVDTDQIVSADNINKALDQSHRKVGIIVWADSIVQTKLSSVLPA